MKDIQKQPELSVAEQMAQEREYWAGYKKELTGGLTIDKFDPSAPMGPEGYGWKLMPDGKYYLLQDIKPAGSEMGAGR